MASAEMIAEGNSEKIEDQGEKYLQGLVGAYSAKKFAKMEGARETLV